MAATIDEAACQGGSKSPAGLGSVEVLIGPRICVLSVCRYEGAFGEGIGWEFVLGSDSGEYEVDFPFIFRVALADGLCHDDRLETLREDDTLCWSGLVEAMESMSAGSVDLLDPASDVRIDIYERHLVEGIVRVIDKVVCGIFRYEIEALAVDLAIG